MEKNYITISAVNTLNKIKTAFKDVILRNLTTIKVKTLLQKNALRNSDKYLSFDINGKDGVDVLLHQPASHPFLSYWVG